MLNVLSVHVHCCAKHMLTVQELRGSPDILADVSAILTELPDTIATQPHVVRAMMLIDGSLYNIVSKLQHAKLSFILWYVVQCTLE